MARLYTVITYVCEDQNNEAAEQSSFLIAYVKCPGGQEVCWRVALNKRLTAHKDYSQNSVITISANAK